MEYLYYKKINHIVFLVISHEIIIHNKTSKKKRKMKHFLLVNTYIKISYT